MIFDMCKLGIVERIFFVNFIEIGRICIACESSKLGIEGISEIKFQTKQVHGSI